MTDNVYYDRYGKPVDIGDSGARRPREGAFGIFIADNRILVSVPGCNPDTMDLPGGGIDEGESVLESLHREVVEETSLVIDTSSPERKHNQHVKFFAEYSDEGWDYKQHYFMWDETDISEHLFTGIKKPKDALESFWLPLSDIPSLENRYMRHDHLQALKAMGVVK